MKKKELINIVLHSKVMLQTNLDSTFKTNYLHEYNCWIEVLKNKYVISKKLLSLISI